MKAPSTSIAGLIAAACSTLFLVGAAQAQGGGNNSSSAATGSSIDCVKDSYSTSGTGSSMPLKSHRSVNTSYLQLHGNLPSAYSQCTANKDRSARAECIRRTYENRSETVASSGTRRPC